MTDMWVSIPPNYHLSYDGYASKYPNQLLPNYHPTTIWAMTDQLLPNYHPSYDGYVSKYPTQSYHPTTTQAMMDMWVSILPNLTAQSYHLTTTRAMIDVSKYPAILLPNSHPTTIWAMTAQLPPNYHPSYDGYASKYPTQSYCPTTTRAMMGM